MSVVGTFLSIRSIRPSDVAHEARKREITPPAGECSPIVTAVVELQWNCRADGHADRAAIHAGYDLWFGYISISRSALKTKSPGVTGAFRDQASPKINKDQTGS